jgi:methyl-accepting chemotaxis protein
MPWYWLAGTCVVAGALAATAVAAAASQAWWLAGVAVLLAAALPPFALLRTSRDGRLSEPRAIFEDEELPAAERLMKQVVPVWKRNMDAAKMFSERSMDTLLETFSSVSSQVDKVLESHGATPQLEVGTIDRLLANHQPQLDALLSSTRAAVKLKNDMACGVEDMSSQLTELVRLSKQVQTIGRATHLLAMNASVEATRAGNASGGFGVVALEVQQLAVQSRETGAQIAKHVASMQQRAESLKWHARRHDADDDEIALQAEENARAVLAQFVASVAKMNQSSRNVRNASKALQADLEKIFTGFQSQDRLSQMMSAVTDDMQRLSAWLSGEDDAAAHSPRTWLDRLEVSYTMEDQRSSHHDVVMVEKSTSVEFF